MPPKARSRKALADSGVNVPDEPSPTKSTTSLRNRTVPRKEGIAENNAIEDKALPRTRAQAASKIPTRLSSRPDVPEQLVRQEAVGSGSFLNRLDTLEKELEATRARVKMLEGDNSKTQEQLKQTQEQLKQLEEKGKEDRKYYEDRIRRLKDELASVSHGHGAPEDRQSDPKSEEKTQNENNDLELQSAMQQVVRVMVEKVITTVKDELRQGQDTEGQRYKRRREDSCTPNSQQQKVDSPNASSAFGSPLESPSATPSSRARATVNKHANIHDEHSGIYSIHFKSRVNDKNVEEVVEALPLAYPERLSSITSIVITGTQFAHPSSSVFTGSTLCRAGRLPALSSLSISGHAISYEGAVSIGKLSSLTSLELSNCTNINSITLSNMLPGLCKLEHLGLSSTSVKEAGIRILSQHLSGSLKSLNVTSCDGLTDAAFVHLSSCKRLEKLEAGHLVKLSDAGLLQLVELPLKHVMLKSSSNVTGAWLQKLDGEVIDRLESLDLSHTKVTDDVLKHLAAEATGLKILKVRSCPSVTQHGLKDFRQLGRELTVENSVTDAYGFRRSSLIKR